MAVLYPASGDFAKVFGELSELVSDVREIRTTTDGPTLGLVVSDDVYDRWVDAQSDSEESETPKRRPGRPRKSQES